MAGKVWCELGKTSEWGRILLSDVIVAQTKAAAASFTKAEKKGTIYIFFINSFISDMKL